jgi:2-oxoglutarate dehydrogenase complex dehydrogenase (E1) component-like enzyme
MENKNSIVLLQDSFSFKKGVDFLDVTVHHSESWLELKIETTESFPIESLEELDFIYEKLKEALKSTKE